MARVPSCFNLGLPGVWLLGLAILLDKSSAFLAGTFPPRPSVRCLHMGGIKQSFGSGGGDMRIKIQGTTNAYTTLRPLDVVLYGLDPEVNGKSRALGVFKAGEVAPLCNRVAGCTEFYRDATQSPLSAEKLKQAGLMLRVVSSDRRGDSCFIIEEYLDEDIHIPLVTEEQAAQGPAPLLSPSAPSKTATAPQPASPFALRQVLSLVQQQLLDTNALLSDALQKFDQVSASPYAESSVPRSSGVIEQISSPNAPAPVGPYSQAVRANGFLFLSGSLGLVPSTGRLAEGGIIFEASQALDNIEAILEAAGSSMSKVVKTTILLKSIKDASVVNNLYKERFSTNEGGVLPARTTFEVSNLPLSAAIEIEVVALAC